MNQDPFYRHLITFIFIYLGLGILLEYLLATKIETQTLQIPLRYFYWVFNGITLIHLIIVVFYKLEKNESKRSRILFFSVINHFIVSLIAITFYVFMWWQKIDAEGGIATIFYLISFTIFMAITLQASKK